MTRPIDADILKEAIKTYDKFACLPNGILEPFRKLEHPEMFEPYIHFRDVIKAIGNAPTIPLPDFKEGYKQAIRDGKTNFSRHEEEIALNIACDLLTGATLYGYDFERIFDEIMEHKGCVSSIQIKEYILDHIEELGKEYFSRESEADGEKDTLQM